MRCAVFVAAFAAFVQASGPEQGRERGKRTMAYTRISTGEVLPTAASYIFVCPLGTAQSVVIPETNFSVIAVWEKLAADAGCDEVEIDAALPKYLARVDSADEHKLQAAYGKHVAKLAPGHVIIATARTGRKVHTHRVMLLRPVVTHSAEMVARAMAAMTATPAAKARNAATLDRITLKENMERVTDEDCESLVRSISGEDPVLLIGGPDPARPRHNDTVTIATRYSFSEGNLAALDWIHDWIYTLHGVTNLLTHFTSKFIDGRLP
ncbi:hypothetical protein DIPPA_31817 [Diplonema papillatum]|nr:hypothetical protein DIPPA_31817 [Diplonema papillatum]